MGSLQGFKKQQDSFIENIFKFQFVDESTVDQLTPFPQEQLVPFQRPCPAPVLD